MHTELHPCEVVYNAAGQPVHYGDTAGVCRITGKEDVGVPFEKWVKKTFTDFDYLHEGAIVSNAALFCFDEASDVIQHRTGRDKKQRFRTYTHFVCDDVWHILTKADKALMWKMITEKDPEIVCIAESGQKHLLFKHRLGMWQFEEKHLPRDLQGLKVLQRLMSELYTLGFTQEEIATGKYLPHRLFKIGLDECQLRENTLKRHRGSLLFDFAAFFMSKIEGFEIETVSETQPVTVASPTPPNLQPTLF